MICPYCGFVDKTVPIPDVSQQNIVLGRCVRCGEAVCSEPTTNHSESSKDETVAKGEARERSIADQYCQWLGLQHEKNMETVHIDRVARNLDGRVVFYFEVKERSCSLNAYEHTKFPYNKIVDGKRLAMEKNVPVFILLKFTDCLARMRIDPMKRYQREEKPFAPNHRPEQKESEHQKPVLIPVEELEILSLREDDEGRLRKVSVRIVEEQKDLGAYF